MPGPERRYRKSRNGCTPCKQRRIKCDELLPHCTNCVRRAMRCTYVMANPTVQHDKPVRQSARMQNIDPAVYHPKGFQGTIATTCQNLRCTYVGCRNTVVTSVSHACRYPPPVPPSKYDFTSEASLSDLELMHHFSTHTFETMSNQKSLQSVWKYAVPHHALRFPYLMRCVLALSSLHLSRLRPRYQEEYLSIACAHHYEGLVLFRREYDGQKKPDAAAAYLVAMLTALYSFGSPRTDPASFGLIDGKGAKNEWFVMVQGVFTVLHSSNDWLDGSPLRSLLIGARPFETCKAVRIDNPEVHTRLFSLFWLCDRFSQVCLPSQGATTTPESQQNSISSPEAVPDPVKSCSDSPQDCSNAPTSDESPDAMALREALHALQRCFHVFYTLDPEECIMDTVLVWPIFLPQRYLDLLKNRNPVALVILAHWCVLMNEIKAWWIEGWPEHILRSVESMINPAWVDWIEWPIQKIRNTKEMPSAPGQAHVSLDIS